MADIVLAPPTLMNDLHRNIDHEPFEIVKVAVKELVQAGKSLADFGQVATTVQGTAYAVIILSKKKRGNPSQTSIRIRIDE
mmetsp:Transcript_30886/g.55988  ORF Transcript_30886/g.55988 Transcript_30886/m.55988 type:complete len:81 (-) Transcript_30886:118-360(-)